MLSIASLLNLIPTPTTPPPLLALPAELRLQILSYIIALPDLYSIFDMVQRENNVRFEAWRGVPTNSAHPLPYIPQRNTPPILLVCKKLTTEAFDILSKLFDKEWSIPARVPTYLQHKHADYRLTHFICKETLLRFKLVKIEIVLGHDGTRKILQTLVDLWSYVTDLRKLTLSVVQGEQDGTYQGSMPLYTRTSGVELPVELTWERPRGLWVEDVFRAYHEWRRERQLAKFTNADRRNRPLAMVW